MQTIQICTGKSYSVLVGNQLIHKTAELLTELGSFKRVAIITDDHVAPLYLETVKQSFSDETLVHTLALPHGEQTKSVENLAILWSFYAEHGFTRSDLVIALGGGVIGDLTGFSASSYLRGIPYVQIPTTLLAQVDSSVGGKTAINIAQGKNLVGSFYQPRLVICDTDTLKTLTPEIVSDGLGEVIKYACIWCPELVDEILSIRDNIIPESIISTCIRIKAEVVAQDEFDTAIRMILNFGHTIGHAVEKYHHFKDYTHGQGVAIGMVHLTRLAEKAGLTPIGCADKIEALCKHCGLPTICDVPNDELFAICCLDKKNLNASIHLILLNEIGKCYIHRMSQEEFRALLNQ